MPYLPYLTLQVVEHQTEPPFFTLNFPYISLLSTGFSTSSHHVDVDVHIHVHVHAHGVEHSSLHRTHALLSDLDAAWARKILVPAYCYGHGYTQSS